MANIKTSELTIKDSPSTSATLVGVDNGETVQIPIGALGGGSSSGGGASGGNIITVDALPTENIDASAIYLVTQPELVGVKMMAGSSDMTELGHIVEIVDTLPSNPIVATDANNSYTHLYWLISNSVCYGYLDDELASAMSMTSGWHPYESLMAQFGGSYGGVIESTDQVTDEGAYYILVSKANKKNLYHYKNGVFAKIASFASTSDIVSTPNPCIYKVYEIDKLETVITETDENGNVVNAYVGVDEDEGFSDCYVEVVDELPEFGESFINMESMVMYLYYLQTDNICYSYVTEELSAMFEAPVGWMPFNEPTIIYSLEEATSTAESYLLATKKPHLYFYDGEWIEIPTGFRMVHNRILETITFIES